MAGCGCPDCIDSRMRRMDLSDEREDQPVKLAAASPAQPAFSGEHSMNVRPATSGFQEGLLRERGDAAGKQGVSEGRSRGAGRAISAQSQMMPADAPEWKCHSCGGDALWCPCAKPKPLGLGADLREKASQLRGEIAGAMKNLAEPRLVSPRPGFQVKDSGAREHFTSGMQRDTQEGKPRWDLAMDGPLLRELFSGDQVVQAFFEWYANPTIYYAERVIRLMASAEGGLSTFLTGFSVLMAEGAKKYNERNWMQASGEPERKRFIASACRHFFQWRFGDRSENHAAAVLFNMNGTHYVLHQQQMTGAESAQAWQVRLADFPVDAVSLIMLPAVADILNTRAARYGVQLEFSPLLMHSEPRFSGTIRATFNIAVDRIESQLRKDFGGDWQAMFRGGGCE